MHGGVVVLTLLVERENLHFLLTEFYDSQTDNIYAYRSYDAQISHGLGRDSAWTRQGHKFYT